AIVNFVLGGLNLCGALCIGIALIFAAALAGKMPPPPPGQPSLNDLISDVDKNAPYLKYYLGAMSAIQVVVHTVEIIAGIGLLKMRYWGRSTSIFFALASIILTLIGTVYSFYVVNPAMEKATQEMMAKANNPKGGPGAPPANPFAGNPIGNALG